MVTFRPLIGTEKNVVNTFVSYKRRSLTTNCGQTSVPIRRMWSPKCGHYHKIYTNYQTGRKMLSQTNVFKEMWSLTCHLAILGFSVMSVLAWCKETSRSGCSRSGSGNPNGLSQNKLNTAGKSLFEKIIFLRQAEFLKICIYKQPNLEKSACLIEDLIFKVSTCSRNAPVFSQNKDGSTC